MDTHSEYVTPCWVVIQAPWQNLNMDI